MSAMGGPPEHRPDPRISSGPAAVPPYPDLDGLSPEERQAAVQQHQILVDLWKLQVMTLVELAKVGAEASRLAMGQALVINAGGAAALVGLLGHMAGRGAATFESLLPRVGPALLVYAAGVTLAVIVPVCATLSHNAAIGMRATASNRWRLAAALMFGMSLGAFGAGTVAAAIALLVVARS